MTRLVLNLSTALVALAASGAVHAADLDAPLPASNSWTGAYLGGALGGAVLDDPDRVLFDTDLDGGFGDIIGGAGNNAFAPGFCNAIARGNEPTDGCDGDDDVSGMVSLRAGYDQQFGSFVLGVVGEATLMDFEDVTTAFSVTPAFYSIVRELDFTLAARARAGYATDRLLAYGTAGVAYGSVDYSFRTSNNPNTFTIDEDVDKLGYQVGGGLEYRLTDRISLSGEYLYTSFGDDSTVRASDGGNVFVAANADGTDFTLDDDFDYHTVSIGLNFRF